MFFNLFKKKEQEKPTPKKTSTTKVHSEKIATRKGEIGEYKIDIQLAQLPKDYLHLSDLLIPNEKSISNYSQIDHLIMTPYGIFVIETKNYQGTIYGGKDRKEWLINGKFKMPSPLIQNYGHIQALKSLIPTNYHDKFISIISFTKRCTFKVEEELRKIASNELVIYDIELTDFINRKISILKLQHKKPLISTQEIQHIYKLIIESNITDLAIRKLHIENIEKKKEMKNECAICQKKVSDKVSQFYLSNPKFEGKIYCYEHQKKG